MWKPFIHVDDQTVNKAFGGNEYQIGADNQTIFQALEALGVGAFQIWRVSILGDSCLDPITQTQAPRMEPRLPHPWAWGSEKLRPWRRSSHVLTPLPLGLSFRVTSRGHSSRWTSGMASRCLMSTSAPWKMESNTSITMWAFSE